MMEDEKLLDGGGPEEKARLLAIWGTMLASQYGQAVYSWGIHQLKQAVNSQLGHQVFDNQGKASGLGSLAKKARGGMINGVAGVVDLTPCNPDGSFKSVTQWGWLGSNQPQKGGKK